MRTNTDIEFEYISEVILVDWLGLPEICCSLEAQYIELSIHASAKRIRLPNVFFSEYSNNNFDFSSLLYPKSPLFNPNQIGLQSILTHETVPIIFGLDGKSKEDTTYLPIDIFGSAFFMLTRLEEITSKVRDDYDRFPARESLAYKNGFLDRPIIDEYVNILWATIKKTWPLLERKKNKFSIFVTHDIDLPFEDALLPTTGAIKRFVSQIITHKDVRRAMDSTKRWIEVRSGNIEKDRFNVFDFLIMESQKRSLKDAFYFLPHGSRELYLKYKIDLPIIKKVIKKLDINNCEIGFHASFDSYANRELFLKESRFLREIADELQLTNAISGGRQHYLRWRNPDTLINWELGGFSYDSTLGYAELPGFRCGTCMEFKTFDIVNRMRLHLVERPLIAMDCTITAERYMDLGFSEVAYSTLKDLKDKCKMMNGNFVLLWHNSELISPEQRELFLSVLDA